MSEPEAAKATRRQQLTTLLRQGVDYTLADLEEALGAPVPLLEADLRHIEKSARHEGLKLVVKPASCRACGFVFKGRELKHLHAPSRCPECKSERIEEPGFQLLTSA